MKSIFVLLFVISVCLVEGRESGSNELSEARGKAKYALLTHLAIMLASKLGLMKIFLGIALVVASIKIIVVMAWSIAIFKYVPDLWPKLVDKHHSYDKLKYNSNKFGYNQFSNYDKFEVNLPYYNSIDNQRFPKENIFVHFFYVVATKLFVLKIIYGILFYVLLSKGWHFVIWFIHYLKEKKQHEEHIEHDHEPVYFDHGHHGHHYEHDYEPYHGHYDHHGEEEYYQEKRVYDSDGSYSIKGP